METIFDHNITKKELEAMLVLLIAPWMSSKIGLRLNIMVLSIDFIVIVTTLQLLKSMQIWFLTTCIRFLVLATTTSLFKKVSQDRSCIFLCQSHSNKFLHHYPCSALRLIGDIDAFLVLPNPLLEPIMRLGNLVIEVPVAHVLTFHYGTLVRLLWELKDEGSEWSYLYFCIP